MATRVDRGKMRLTAFDGSFPKTPLKALKSRKNLLRKLSYSPFCPKFRCYSNGDQSGKNSTNSIRWLNSENSFIGAKISYASRVIADFVPNFLAMATRGSRRKMRLAAFDGLSQITLLQTQKISQKSSRASRVIAHFVPNFVATGTVVGREKMRLAAFDGPFPKTFQ